MNLPLSPLYLLLAVGFLSLLAQAHERREKRNFRFMHLRLARPKAETPQSAPEKGEQIEEQTAPDSEETVPVPVLHRFRNDVKRPCYFSPVQCLLRTPDQHRVFENHPRINDPLGAQTLSRGGQDTRSSAGQLKLQLRQLSHKFAKLRGNPKRLHRHLALEQRERTSPWRVGL